MDFILFHSVLLSAENKAFHLLHVLSHFIKSRRRVCQKVCQDTPLSLLQICPYYRLRPKTSRSVGRFFSDLLRSMYSEIAMNSPATCERAISFRDTVKD